MALPAPGTGATARRFGSGLENEFTPWKGASLRKWWGSSLHRETRRVLLYFSPPSTGLQPGGRQRGEAVSDFGRSQSRGTASQRGTAVSLYIVRSIWRIFLLHVSLRVSTVLSSAVSHSSGDCISGTNEVLIFLNWPLRFADHS